MKEPAIEFGVVTVSFVLIVAFGNQNSISFYDFQNCNCVNYQRGWNVLCRILFVLSLGPMFYPQGFNRSKYLHRTSKQNIRYQHEQDL